MEDLPKKALSNVASYLERTTRAIFAAALTASSSSWDCWASNKQPSLASKIVMSSPYYDLNSKKQYEENWQELDVGECGGERVRNKLTDADVCGILVCINAKHKVKKLQLTQCTSVRGKGLAPLRASSVLEEIDLSLVKYSTPSSIDPKASISELEVLPILQNIIDQDERSLKFLLLPWTWRERHHINLELFLRSYNKALNKHKLACFRCDCICRGTKKRPWVSVEDEDYGIQAFTCHVCMDYFCAECEDEIGLIFCTSCEKRHCAKCASLKMCVKCHDSDCTIYMDFYTCNICEKTHCVECDSSIDCYSCNRVVCGECLSNITCKICKHYSSCMECVDDCAGFVKQCSNCDEVFCTSCRSSECCFELGSELCLGCHNNIHGPDNIIDCYWSFLHPILRTVILSYHTPQKN